MHIIGLHFQLFGSITGETSFKGEYIVFSLSHFRIFVERINQCFGSQQIMLLVHHVNFHTIQTVQLISIEEKVLTHRNQTPIVLVIIYRELEETIIFDTHQIDVIVLIVHVSIIYIIHETIHSIYLHTDRKRYFMTLRFSIIHF